MSARALLDWCPLCGEKLSDNFVATRLWHDRIFHPGYILAQMGISECEHEEKTYYLEIQFVQELPLFHLEFCDECYKTVPIDGIVKDEKIVKIQSKLDGEQS